MLYFTFTTLKCKSIFSRILFNRNFSNLKDKFRLLSFILCVILYFIRLFTLNCVFNRYIDIYIYLRFFYLDLNLFLFLIIPSLPLETNCRLWVFIIIKQNHIKIIKPILLKWNMLYIFQFTNGFFSYVKIVLSISNNIQNKVSMCLKIAAFSIPEFTH